MEHGLAGAAEAYADMRTRTIVCASPRAPGGAHRGVARHEIPHTYLHDPTAGFEHPGFDYAGCRGQAEALAYIVTALGVEAAQA